MTGYNNNSFSERALQLLEKDICYLSYANWGYGMPAEDVAQELRFHLWSKIHLYDPRKSSLRTWAQQVMRRRLISLKRKAEYGRGTGIPRNMLDSSSREHLPELGNIPQKEPEEEWEYTEITITTFTMVA